LGTSLLLALLWRWRPQTSSQLTPHSCWARYILAGLIDQKALSCSPRRILACCLRMWLCHYWFSCAAATPCLPLLVPAYLTGLQLCLSFDRIACALLQTVSGSIPYWNLLLLWPYHVGLRGKLWIQRRTSTEPHWTLITDGWYGECSGLCIVAKSLLGSTWQCIHVSSMLACLLSLCNSLQHRSRQHFLCSTLRQQHSRLT